MDEIRDWPILSTEEKTAMPDQLAARKAVQAGNLPDFGGARPDSAKRLTITNPARVTDSFSYCPRIPSPIRRTRRTMSCPAEQLNLLATRPR